MASQDNFTDICKVPNNLNDHSDLSMENISNDDEETKAEKNKIRAALNLQTIIQYRQYAVDQFPKEYLKQEELIRQLQDQHFKTYWTNVHLEMCRHQKEQTQLIKDTIPEENMDPTQKSLVKGELAVIPANMWTRKNVTDFKSELWNKERSNCIKISSLSAATVRVPTYKDGRSIFWEFATDNYDIGFGVSFEWNKEPEEKVELTMSDTSDDEEDEDEETKSTGADLEVAVISQTPEENNTHQVSVKSNETQIPCDELITAYRRECHMEVYCGSHKYPGKGYYLLKFDNSYSVWRSKSLYYRVYHTS